MLSDNADQACTLPEVRLVRELAAGSFSGLEELDLTNRGLCNLPSELCVGLPGLTHLNMGMNSLSTLPPEMEHLTRLRVAFFLGNRFKEVPRVVGRLPSLFMLSFKNCQLTSVPEESLAPSLGWLILTGNRLTSLPASLGRLRHLRKLMLASNHLRSLPDMSGCLALELVRLSDNRLTEVPRDLLALPRLAWIALAGNLLPPRLRDMEQHQQWSHLSFCWSQVELGRQLGKGASGTVYEATMQGQCRNAGGATNHLERGQPVAVKVFQPTSSDGRPVDEIAAAIALAEQSAWHPNLIHTYGCIDGEQSAMGQPTKQPAIVMELLDSMVLLGKTPSLTSVTRDVYQESDAFSLLFVLNVAHGVASAVAHIHAHGIIHGDVYAHNVLVGSAQEQKRRKAQWRVKLGDLGAAFFLPTQQECASDTALLLQRIESRALGCLLEELTERLVRDKSDVGQSATLALLCQLRDSCLQPDVSLRPTAFQLASALKGELERH